MMTTNPCKGKPEADGNRSSHEDCKEFENFLKAREIYSILKPDLARGWVTRVPGHLSRDALGDVAIRALFQFAS